LALVGAASPIALPLLALGTLLAHFLTHLRRCFLPHLLALLALLVALLVALFELLVALGRALLAGRLVFGIGLRLRSPRRNRDRCRE
jgi:prepilin signal peptidase PulO-like enzyme (type II secretory pathway)